MKCEGCPFSQHVYGFKDNRVGNPKVHKWYPNDVCRKRRDSCHLTPATFPLINRALTGSLSAQERTVLEAIGRGEVPDDALAVVRVALRSTDFAIDDVEERENGDKFISLWYREQPKEQA